MTVHKPVLLKEVVDGLNLDKGSVVFDGTLGGGGYLKEICRRVGPDGIVIGTDQDIEAIERLEKENFFECRIHFINENFRNLDKVLNVLKHPLVDAVVFDLGLSSDQFESSGRGFAFKKNEPLLMTFDKNPKKARFTAEEILNNWEEENIADILYGYGEERFAKRIATKIVEERKKSPIKTTKQLSRIIESAVPTWYLKTRKIHPATKTFQALRITVNDEIGSLKEGLEKGFDALKRGGRLAVVSFHSIEDRIVKRFMKEKQNKKAGFVITKKPIIPTEEEIKKNPRSRSAKLRIIEKI